MSASKTSKSIALGSHVEVSKLNRRGVVQEGPNNKGEYAVQMGALCIWVPASQLKMLFNPTKGAAKPKDKTSSYNQKRYSAKSTRESRTISIDLHGLIKTQAVELLETTLDRALLEDRDCIEIIHGLGSGALKNAVEKYLEKCPHVAKFQLMPNNAGTTIAYLK